MTNCFNIIALVIIRENKTKIANYFHFSFKKNMHLNMHCVRVIAIIIERMKFSTSQCAPFSITTSAILLKLIKKVTGKVLKQTELVVANLHQTLNLWYCKSNLRHINKL